LLEAYDRRQGVVLKSRPGGDKEVHHLWGQWVRACVLMVNSCIKVRLDLQADKSPIVVKGPFFPRVVNPRYRIRRTNV
jgi:hypothetical protein